MDCLRDCQKITCTRRHRAGKRDRKIPIARGLNGASDGRRVSLTRVSIKDDVDRNPQCEIVVEVWMSAFTG